VTTLTLKQSDRPRATSDPMTVAVFVAVIVHAFVLLGVSFEQESPPPRALNSLDIVLVQHSSEASPDDAQHLAQANQEGGGDADETERAATPIPTPLAGERAQVVAASPPVPEVTEQAVLPTPEPATADIEQPRPSPEPETQAEASPAPVLASTDAKPDADVKTAAFPRPRPKPEHLREPQPQQQLAAAAPPTINASRLVSRSLAMASLSAEVNRKLSAYAERPRQKWISARTREVKYAAYMEAWHSKVERIGNLNYPDEARRRGLSGKLILNVAIKADGTLQSVRVRRSSGQRVLDDAALRIVKLAAPYAPFPASFKDEIDVLHIERTWRFLGASNRLASR